MSLRALAPSRFRARLAAAQRSDGWSPRRSDAGFTLVELVIVIGIMPLVIGAIAVGTLSVFSLQKSVSNRLTDSGDAQLVSLNFQNDVQSAAMMTTSNSAQNPAPCGSGFQVLGLQLGNDNQITYATAAAAGGTYNLSRNVCSGGSSTPTSSQVIARDLPCSVLPSAPSCALGYVPPVTIPSCATGSTAAACAPGPSNSYAYQNGWVPTVGVAGVTFNTTSPNAYAYQVVAVPAAGSNTVNPATPPTPSTGCSFATPGTGTYASKLCFVDFSPWNNLTTGPPANSNCQSGQFYMSAGIVNSPYTLSFCMSVTSSQFNNNCGGGCAGTAGQSISGYVAQNDNACGVPNRSGWDNIDAVQMPTYACPPTSEAFLGNNGFYTGVPGYPALYTVFHSSTSVISFTHIQVLTASGGVATGWQLATGDAESTDTSESATWTSDQNLNLIPNSSISPVGNACDSVGQHAPPGYNPTYLTGVGTTTVTCSSPISEDHTGTTMLEAKMPSTLTVTLYGGGLQATFLGVLLQ